MVARESYQGIDQKLKQVDEIVTLRGTLQEVERKASELSVIVKDLMAQKYKEKNHEIQEKIIEICKLKNFDIESSGNILKISYKNFLSFVVNLSEETRYISRSEEGKKILGFKINYKENTKIPAPISTLIYTSEIEGLKKKIANAEKAIQYNEVLLEALPNIGLDIEIEYDDQKVVKIQKLEQLIDLMFR